MAGDAPPSAATRAERVAWSMYDFANSGRRRGSAAILRRGHIPLDGHGCYRQCHRFVFRPGDRRHRRPPRLEEAIFIVYHHRVRFDDGAAGLRWRRRRRCGLDTAHPVFGDVRQRRESDRGFSTGNRPGSAYGETLGLWLGLGCCLTYITWAQNQGQNPSQFIPVTLWMTAVIFAVAALPTFIVLRERATPKATLPGKSYLAEGLVRVRTTLRDARRFKDLYRFLITLVVYQAGVSTVVVVAAIYAQEVLEFSSDELIFLVMIVNVTAAVGALAIGHLQDKVGSSRALALALSIWVIAVVLVLVAESRADIWLAANLIGLAMGSSQSAGRALMGHFTPVGRAGEFFGLWGMASRCAAIIGPATYGAISMLSGGNQRIALLSTLGFFLLGLLLLTTVSEARGRRAAMPLGMN